MDRTASLILALWRAACTYLVAVPPHEKKKKTDVRVSFEVLLKSRQDFEEFVKFSREEKIEISEAVSPDRRNEFKKFNWEDKEKKKKNRSVAETSARNTVECEANVKIL